EALLVGATLGGVDRVRVGVHRLGVRAGPLHGDLEGDLAVGVLGLDVDDLGVDELDLLRRVEVRDVVTQPVLVLVGDLPAAGVGVVGGALVVTGDLVSCIGDAGALVGQGEAQALVEERHLLEAGAQRLEVEVGGLEDVGVGPERHGRAGPLGAADAREGSGGDAVLVALAPDVAGAVHLDVQPRGQGVDDGHTHTVQTTGDGVAAAAELAAGVQDGEDDLDGRLALGLDDVHGDAAAVVDDAHAAVGQDRHVDGGRVAGQCLVDGVVDDLVDEVVQAAL